MRKIIWLKIKSFKWWEKGAVSSEVDPAKIADRENVIGISDKDEIDSRILRPDENLAETDRNVVGDKNGHY